MSNPAIQLSVESFTLNRDHALEEINRTDFPYEWAGKAGGHNYDCQTLHRYIEEREWDLANVWFQKIIREGVAEAVSEEIFEDEQDALRELMGYFLDGGIKV